MNQLPVKNGRRAAGVTVMEVILTLAGIALLTTIGVTILTGQTESARRVRLERTVAQLNHAIAAFRTHGGTLPREASPSTVLALLKTTAPAKTQAQHPGLRQSMIDLRLRPVAAMPADSVRVIWDSATQRFSLAGSGEGWRDFELDESVAVESRGTAERRAMLAFASRQPWVWDYADGKPPRATPLNIPAASPLTGPMEADPPPVRLQPPLIDPATGIFPYRNYPLTVTITDPNPPGTAIVRFRVDRGAWEQWDGSRLAFARHYYHEIEAIAEAPDGESAENSAATGREYTTYYLAGRPAGVFGNPTGDTAMVCVLSAGASDFAWGRVESDGQTSSRFRVDAPPGVDAGPGESVRLATLHYDNGTSRAGTNATGVTVTVTLALAAPAGETLTLTIPLRMQNTIHYPWTEPEERRDYIWLPASAGERTLQIHDRRFRVTVAAECAESEPDGTELRIPVDENGSADIGLIAMLDPL